MLYGYCRISTPKQSIERQIRNILKLYPEAILIKEAYTGTSLDRPQWKRLFSAVKAGDTIVFDSVSRMSRNADEGMEAYEALFNRGVNLIFIKEPQINTDTYKAARDRSIPMVGSAVDYILDGINKFLLELAKEQIKISFEQSEKEVEDLHQRTKEGLITARLNGKQIGQIKGSKLKTKKGEATKAIIKKHSIDFGGTLSDVECQALAGVSRNTYYKYKKEVRKELSVQYMCN